VLSVAPLASLSQTVELGAVNAAQRDGTRGDLNLLITHDYRGNLFYGTFPGSAAVPAPRAREPIYQGQAMPAFQQSSFFEKFT
jgi:hypothetical protein